MLLSNKYDVLSSTGAVRAAVINGTIWFLLSILIFILPTKPSFVLGQVTGLCFIILPVVNHIGIFIAIRRHNKQVANVVSGQNLSVIFRREKKAAMDMLIVMAVLMFCLVPGSFVNVFVNMFGGLLGDKFEPLYAWAAVPIFLNSSINPVIYYVRNREVRNAVRSIMSF